MKELFCYGLFLCSVFINSALYSSSRSSISDCQSYKETCLYASSHIDDFKKNPEYNKILEHLTYDDGLAYLTCISSNYPFLLSKIEGIKKNDSLGNPTVYDYPQVGTISPTTLRYVKIAGDIIRHFGNLERYRILEIGGGYGGQALILNQLFSLKRYFLIDLPEALHLQAKYLSHFGVPYKTIQCDSLSSVANYDLVISNYAFSECEEAVQKLYLEKVISKAQKGYMICNQLAEYTGVRGLQKETLVEELSKLGFKVVLLEEEPLTFEGNFVLVFSRN